MHSTIIGRKVVSTLVSLLNWCKAGTARSKWSLSSKLRSGD